MMSDTQLLDDYNPSEEAMECECICHWEHLFNNDTRKTMQEAVYNAGLTTMIVGLLLNLTLLMSKKLRSEKAYQNLLNYTMAATLRRTVPVMAAILPFRCLIDDWIGHNKMSCDFFGFVDTFFAVFEMESLAQVAIERFIRALYIYKGWHNPNWHNKLFVFISLVLATVYSAFPLFGYGNYGRDFDCVSCTFDIVLPTNAAHRLIVIIIFMLKNIKPIVVMIFSLNFARWMELHKIEKDHKNNVILTFSICVVVMVKVVFWFPIFLVRSTVVFAQLMNKNYTLIWSPCFVIWAMFMYWLAPAVAMVGFIWFNPRVRVKMVNSVSQRPIDSDEPTTPAKETSAEETKAQETIAQETKAQEARGSESELKQKNI